MGRAARLGAGLRVALALAAALGALPATLLAVWGLDRLVFQPTRGVALAPDALGIPAQEVRLEAEDGVRLHAYRVPPAAPRAAEALGLALLFLHGNAGNASHRLPNAALLAGLGLDVLVLDYRGYGLSEGRPSEAGVYADARAALAWLEREADYPPERVLVFGRSLGGAVAVELARGRPLAGLILESTFTSIADIARSMLGTGLGPLLRGRFDAASRIGSVRAPILVLHGDRDRTIPLALGRRLFERAPEPKAFRVIRGAGHDDTVEVGGRAYLERLHRFAEEAARSAEGSP